MQIREIMTREPQVLTSQQSLRQAAELFSRCNFDGAPVIDETGKMVNIVTKGDITRAYLADQPADSSLANLPRRQLRTIGENADLVEAWEIKVGRLPVLSASGELVGIVTRTDIVKALLEQGLEETRELTAIFDSTRNGFVVVDGEYVVRRMNKSALRILSLADGEVIGRDVRQTLPGIVPDRLIEENTQSITERLHFRGKTLVCDRQVLRYRNQAVGAVVILQDITDFAAVFEELSIANKLNARLDAIIESSYDGIYITDGQATTLKVNRSYEKMTGVRRDELIGRKMHDLVREGYISRSVTLLVLENRRSMTIEQEVRTGKKLVVTGTPVFDEKNEITMVVTNARDMTELVSLKEELEENRELKEKYFSQLEEIKLQIVSGSELVARDKASRDVLQMAMRIATVDTTIILLGETGVGKEELARFIHKNSHRKDGPFVKINCGAIPDNLLESELFGYEKGAFTGASAQGKQGQFELAEKGTLLLDEIAELPLEMQVKLLRALQEREIKRVGGNKGIKINVRIIAATNRNLEQQVREKKFREDLYYRLQVVPITIPPLRERKGDILPLIFHFLQEINDRYSWNKEILPAAMKALYEYHWPGNVRELKNIIERMVVMSDEEEIGLNSLPSHLTGDSHGRTNTGNLMKLPDAIALLEEEMLENAFRQYGNVRAAAAALGIDASTFVRKRQKLGKRRP